MASTEQITPTHFFNSVAERYHSAYAEQTPGGHALRIRKAKVLAMLNGQHGRVLDVGCGPGVMTRELLEMGCEFWGIDPSVRMIELCRDQWHSETRAHFSLGGAAELVFPDASFDLILCMGVTDFVPDGRRAIQEMFRVLKPNGTLIITFTDLRSPYAWWKRYVFYPLLERLRAIAPSRSAYSRPSAPPTLYTRHTAISLIAANGGRVEKIVGYNANPLLSPFDEIWPRGALWLVSVLESSRYAQWLCSGFIVKSKKIELDTTERAERK